MSYKTGFALLIAIYARSTTPLTNAQETDHSLLTLAREAHAAKRDAHTHGSASFRYSIHHVSSPERWDISNVLMQWDKEREWCVVERWLGAETNSVGTKVPNEKVEYILNEGKVYEYYPLVRKLFIQGQVWAGPAPTLLLMDLELRRVA